MEDKFASQQFWPEWLGGQVGPQPESEKEKIETPRKSFGYKLGPMLMKIKVRLRPKLRALQPFEKIDKTKCWSCGEVYEKIDAVNNGTNRKFILYRCEEANCSNNKEYNGRFQEITGLDWDYA